MLDILNLAIGVALLCLTAARVPMAAIQADDAEYETIPGGDAA